MNPDLLNHALALHQAGMAEKAESLYRELIQENKDNADAQHLLGILLSQQGRLGEALKYLHAALDLTPDSPSFHNSLGNVEKRLGHIEQAIVHYQQALKSPQASAAVHNNLGSLYYAQKEFEKAEHCYHKAIELHLDYADAHYNYSMVLTEQGRYEEAISQLLKTLEVDWEHAEAHTHMAQLLLQQKNPSDAIAHCKQRLKIDPDHIETHHQLAVALTQQNLLEEAVDEYRVTLELDPNHEEALHNLGALYVVQKKPEQALGCYLKLLGCRIDFDAYYNIGVIYLYQDRHGEAIAYLSEALKLEPDSFNVLVNLGAVYLKKETFEKAIFYYQAALDLKPDDPELTYILSALSQTSEQNTAPKKYITNLFDQYAPYFDQHLTEYLKYRVPELLFDGVQKVIGKWPEEKLDNLLDLGCGTGLCGAKFRPYFKKMVGIDLSEQMLEVAARKKIYDILQPIDIQEALERYNGLYPKHLKDRQGDKSRAPGVYTEIHEECEISQSTQSVSSKTMGIDVVIAGDVLGYVGELETLFKLTYQALKKEGLFAFTTEKTWLAEFKLQNNARFAHHRDYIKKLAEQYRFEIEYSESAILRTQKEQTVEGMVWVLRRK